MEVKEEYEEKFNPTDLLFPGIEESPDERKEDGNCLQYMSPFEQPTLSRLKQEENCNLESKYGLKESKVILKRLVMPLSTIKQEQIDEEDNSSQENNYWIDNEFQELTNILNGGSASDLDIKEEAKPIDESHADENNPTELTSILNRSRLPVHEIREETTKIGEINPHENSHEQQITVRKKQRRSTRISLQEHQLKCNLCNYVFGIISSFLNHMKICNNSKNICRSILESIIDAAVTERATDDKNKDHRRPVLFRFSCCEEIFTTFMEFNSHKISKHNIELTVCGLCNCKVNTVKNLFKHYREHHFRGLNIHFDRTLTRRDSASTTANMDEYAGNKDECTAAQQGILCQCPDCSRSFSTENSIETSILRPHACKICNFTFVLKSRLKKHEKTHVGLKNYPCNICAMSFTKQLTLKRHKITQHSSEPSPFKVTCNICSKQLSCKGALHKHIRCVHRKQNKTLYQISCPHCSKPLADKKSLSRHIKMHLQNTEYTCADCNRIYYTKENLVTHIKSHHLPKDLIKCDICGYTTNSSMSMFLHKTKKHSEWRYSCDICGKRFPMKGNLETHLIVHSDDKPFVCKICGKAFKRESNLDQHQYTHSTDRSHLCSICGLSFRLRTHVKQHMAVHGIGNNHKCVICNKFFARKRELNLHMSSHDVS